LQTPANLPTDEEISSYYQQHKDSFQTPEQVSVDYVELSLDDLSKAVKVSDEKLKVYYEEHKDEYTQAERRKISQILFSVNAKTDDKTALAKAQKAKQDLANTDFAKLASEVSDDTATAKKGGDLGLFTAGVMEKPFEEAVNKLKQGEVSEPVKTSFGYHLIKVTELVPEEIKPFESVKDEVTKAYQKSEGEDAFYQAGETLTQMSYEHPDNLQAVASALGLNIKKSSLFSKNKGDGIGAEDKIRSSAFSDEVLQGNNSTPIELGSDKIVVLRLLEHKTASTQELNTVKPEVITLLMQEKAKLLTKEKAAQIKSRSQSNESIQAIATENKLEVKKVSGLTRTKTDLPAPLIEAIFKAAKPVAGKPSIFINTQGNGDQIIVSLLKVTPGIMSEQDKKNQSLAIKNIANALGQADFNAVIDSLQKSAKITVNTKAGN
jgi:peptidyl-prolyl cis-trans isomerase D